MPIVRGQKVHRFIQPTIGFLALTMISLAAHAQQFVVVSEDFELDPAGFEIGVEETGDASAQLLFEDLMGSRALTFQGNWLTDPDIAEFQLAFGVLAPPIQSEADFFRH